MAFSLRSDRSRLSPNDGETVTNLVHELSVVIAGSIENSQAGETSSESVACFVEDCQGIFSTVNVEDIVSILETRRVEVAENERNED